MYYDWVVAKSPLDYTHNRYKYYEMIAVSGAHFQRNLVLVVIFIGIVLSNLICCILFVNAASEMEQVFGNKSFLFLPLHGWLIMGIIVAASCLFTSVQELVCNSLFLFVFRLFCFSLSRLCPCLSPSRS